MKIKLTFLNGSLQGQRFLLTGRVSIGRHPDNALVVEDASVSFRHCEIHFEEGHAFIRDSDSTNGTRVNGITVDAVMLHDGDQVAIGEILCSVQGIAEEPPAAQAEPPSPAHLHIQVDQEPVPAALAGIPSADDKITIVPAAPSPEAQPHPDHPVKVHPTKVLDRSHVLGRTRRRLSPWANRVAALVLAILVCMAFFRSCIPEKNMLSPKAAKDAYRQMNRHGVELTVVEPSGVDRKADPVTSGVPLPQGSVKDIKDLCLMSQDKHTVPCQFTPLCLWPDGSIKWVLLDFQADVAASNKVSYTLCKGRGTPAPEKPVKLDVNGDSWTIDSGALKVCVVTNMPGLMHSVKMGDKEIISATNPVEVVLVNQNGGIYRGSKPTKIVAECAGPMRTTVLVQGQFVDENGSNIYSGKVGYDLRITAYAGKPNVKLDFTLRNDGWYGYRNEGGGHPRQWLYLKSLEIDIPVSSQTDNGMKADFGGKQLSLGRDEETTFTQWYKYPYGHSRGFLDVYRTNPPPHEAAARMDRKLSGYYCTWSTNNVMSGNEGRVEGYACLKSGETVVAGLAVRRFRQNFPDGFAATGQGRLSYVMFPEGGCWPRTADAFYANTYQFEGGRRKTATFLLNLDGDGQDPGKQLKALDSPLFAKAPAEWYRDTGAVVPLARGAWPEKEKELTEAIARYDRMQRAKVRVECGDPGGPSAPETVDRWGKVSIPSLWERCPDVFLGCMNYGDLVWSFGYCSLYYQWPYSMLQQYLRLGDREFLDVGEDMIRHRYDIDQYHVENTAPYLGGFQRSERGEHGHISRQERRQGRNKSWEANCVPSHTWNRCLLLHWALTGDPRSLDAALENGRAFQRFFYAYSKLGEKAKLPYAEFRTPVWAMDNWMALYEYTGEANGLKWANEIFDKTLLAMERDNGSCGHIIKGGKQSAQFTGYMVEPVCRLHHLTGRKDAVEFLKRVLDWQRKAGMLRGEEKNGVYYPILWREDWGYDPELEDVVSIGAGNSYDFPLCDGYAYLHHVFGRKEDLDMARRLFKEGVFYLMFDEVRDRSARSPIGYHHLGDPFGSTPKIHAWTGRYCQLYLYVEEQE